MFDYTSYNVEVGQSRRFDCPRCGGKNTLCITNKNGKILFCCFRASCDQKGVKKVGLRLENLTNKNEPKALPPPPLTIPDTWVKPYHKEVAIKYLKEVNCWDMFIRHKANIFWDLSKERLVFVSANSDGLLGLGRTLTKNVVPKWYVYPGSSKRPFFVPADSPTKIHQCVIVEDAPSAVAVSRLGKYNGVAVIGTHLTLDAMYDIIKHNKAIICLDKDASSKALEIERTLSPYMETAICMLSDDIRYLNDAELKSLLRNV